jgi:two-component system, cell cycle sensor histidine kinase PleC
VDRGFSLIIFGVGLVALATLLDFAAAVVRNLDYQPIMDTVVWDYRTAILAAIFYLPGTVIAGIGMSSWLPALQRLDEEIERRQQTEEELRNLATDLEQLAVKAEEANHAKSTFLASMSHELRTPLNAIIGFSDLISKEIFGPIENTRYIEYSNLISRSGNHLLSIISDILDLSKIEAGQLELSEEPLIVEEVLKDCYVLMAGRMEEKKITFNLNFRSSGTRMMADPRMVMQMIINLLSNAMKFTPEGGAISLSFEKDDHSLCIPVIDNGVGMNEAQIEYVIKPFAQVESVYSKSTEGTGLGLSIVNEMMELHDGALELRSATGKGTAATLRFPIARLIA